MTSGSTHGVASDCSPAECHGHTRILLTWDEDDGSSANRVPLIVASPYTPAGRSSGRPLNHYSLLRASEHVLGIRRFLGEARRFSGLGYAFHL